MYIGGVCVSIYIILCYTEVGHGKKTTSNTKDDDLSASKSLTHFYNGTISPLANLSSIIFRNYDSGVRPYCPGEEEIVDVTVDLALRQLIDLDEPYQIVTMNIWMRLGWRDCQLTWDPNEFAGITQLRVPYSRLWIPDIALYERVSDEFYGLKDYPVQIHSDGRVEYNFPSTVEVVCPVDVTNFPFDTQVCPLKFSSWSYHGFHLNMTSNAMAADLSNVKENVEWIIKKGPAHRRVTYYKSLPYPDLTFSIFIERKPDYHVTNMLLPSFLITCIAILGFLLPVDSGEKVALELTVMLAISVFQLLVADKLPPSSVSTPWIVVYFNFTLFLSGTASLIQVIVLNLHHRADQKMPEWIAFNVLQPLATITFTDVPGFTPCRCISRQDENMVKQEIFIPEDAQLWVLLAKCVDRLGLMLFLLTFSVGTGIIFTAFSL
ncbi:neuronal acetylcholine receptor subunit alpha-10-like [Mytilus californianus]|uniref:neuronal acetylcholine receptor subunit alpha-10-like n=1 Tax=Mytilus californianus TaxID=6549 RepID=UPI0022484582|nr:neuronal acetylcholine receptor subunit alpha-10-like [Mytilus californianus]